MEIPIMLVPKVPVASEGYPFIGFAAFLTVVLAILDYSGLAVLGIAATAFTLYFFRDPERFLPEKADAMVSPADGKIILIEEVADQSFTGGQALKISIFMNVFNVHVNRAPCEGTVDRVIYAPGQFYSADSAQGALHNEYCATLLTTPSGRQLAVVQVAGLIARRIVCWLEPQDRLQRGQRIGMIRFGSRVDLYLPRETSVQVTLGQKVTAGETIIGVLP
jgi:phosphatidylserine decarboxylase